MSGKVAKRLRRISGYRPGTTVKYTMGFNENIRCARPRATYLNLKKDYRRG